MKLGDKVRASQIIVRETDGAKRKWVTQRGAQTGILVGIRTLSNGRYVLEQESWEIPQAYYVWEPDEHFQGAIIAYDLRRKPVYARLEDVTVLD